MIDTAATAEALERSWCVLRSDRDLVTATGEEAATYLHGQISQNITGLGVGDSAWSLVLSPQGRIDAWTRVSRVDDLTFWLDVDPGYGTQLIERLDRFRLRTKVAFELSSVEMISVRGPKSPAPELMGPLAADLPVLWDGVVGFDRVGLSVDLPADSVEGDPVAFEAARIRAGIPRMGAEITEKTIPAEVGVVDRSADFAKGCYVGQELVARIDSRGNNTPRRMWGLVMDGNVPQVGAPVVMDGEVVGSITSAAATESGGVALASIARSAAAPGAATVDDAEARVESLPLVG